MASLIQHLTQNNEFMNTFVYNVASLRNIVNCSAVYLDSNPLTNVTLKIDSNSKEFLREGMFYLSPASKSNCTPNVDCDFGGSNPPDFLFNVIKANKNFLPYLSKDITQKRNVWNDSRTFNTFPTDVLESILNSSLLYFLYASKDDKQDFSSIRDTEDSFTDYCSNSNRDIPPPSPNRDIFQELAKTGVVDMCIASMGFSDTRLIAQRDSVNSNRTKGRFLKDDDDNVLTSKLVPIFEDFEYETRFSNSNFNKFTWTVKYLGDNKFTIQNKYTGRYLKCFNYFDSTYVYVGDDTDIKYNTNEWHIQNIFPIGSKVNDLFDSVVSRLKQDIKLGQNLETESQNYLKNYFCGDSASFIDGQVKLISSYTSNSPPLDTKSGNTFQRIINGYTKICGCNMSENYYYNKNASYSEFLELLQLKNSYCSLGTERKNVATQINTLSINQKTGSPQCSDTLCKKLSENHLDNNFVEKYESPNEASSNCAKNVNCIATSIIENNGIAIGSPFYVNQNINCASDTTNVGELNGIIKSEKNMEPTLVYISGDNKLWAYTKDCYTASIREKNENKPFCDQNNNYTGSSLCILSGDACLYSRKENASSPSLQDVSYNEISERIVKYNFTGTLNILPDNEPVVNDLTNIINKNRNLYLNKIINQNPNKTINETCPSNSIRDSSEPCYKFTKKSSIGNIQNGEIEVKQNFNCGVPTSEECEYKNNKWIQKFYYGNIDTSKNNLGLTPLRGVNKSASQEFKDACKYDFSNKGEIDCPKTINIDCSLNQEPTIEGTSQSTNILYNYAIYNINKNSNGSGKPCSIAAIDLAKQRFGSSLDSTDPGTDIKDANGNITGYKFKVLKDFIDCVALPKTYSEGCVYDTTNKKWVRNFTYNNQNTPCGITGTDPCNETKECSLSSQQDVSIGNCNDNDSVTIGYKIQQRGNNPSSNTDPTNCIAKAKTVSGKNLNFKLNNRPILGEVVEAEETCNVDCKVLSVEPSTCNLEADGNYITHRYMVIDRKGSGKTCDQVIYERPTGYKNQDPSYTYSNNKITMVSYKEPCTPPPPPSDSGSGSGVSGNGTGGTTNRDCQVSVRQLDECKDNKKNFSYNIVSNNTGNGKNCMEVVRSKENASVYSTLQQIGNKIVGYEVCESKQPPVENPPKEDEKSKDTSTTKPLPPSPVTEESKNTYLYVALGIVLMLVLIFAIYKLMKV